MQESFDALKRRYGNNDNVRLFQLALSDSPGEAMFYLNPGVPTNSSLMRRNHPPGREVREITVECATLDDLVRRENLPPPDFLKLDTEGSELRVLRGGQQTLAGEVLGVYCEVGYALPPGAGAQASEIDAYLARNDFILFNLQISRSNPHPIGGKKTRVMSGNVLYLRDFYALYDAHLRAAGEAAAGSKLRKMIAVCAAFIYLPYALELVEFGREKGLLDAAEVARLTRALCGWTDIARRVPAFPGKQALANIFEYLAYCLQPKAKKSVPPMYNNIGNRPRAMVRQRVPKKVTLERPIRMRHEPTVEKVEIELDS